MLESKKRHGCLSALLVFMMVGNAFVASVYLVYGNKILRAMPHMPAWTILFFIAMSIFNIICHTAIFLWKKWGFWGACFSSFLVFGVNLSVGVGVGSSLAGLFGLVLLYGTLRMGKDNTGWSQLD